MSQNQHLEKMTQLPLARRWRQQTHPVATVLAFLPHLSVEQAGSAEARYLLIQRQTTPYAGYWGLIGGRWEFGESLGDAITREVKEETSLDTSFVGLRAVVNERIAPGKPDGESGHFIVFVSELSLEAGEAQEQQEGPVRWFSWAEIAAMNDHAQIIPTDYAILQQISGRAAGLAFIEVEVITQSGEETKDELCRFDPLH